MYKLLFISFDRFRPGEVQKSYAISSIVAFVKSLRPTPACECTCCCVNLGERMLTPEDVVQSICQAYDVTRFDIILLPDYAWAAQLTRPVVSALRSAGFNGKIVLGGYEVTATPDTKLLDDYPYADHCIKGYAEQAVLNLVTGRDNEPVLNVPTVAERLISPYLSDEMRIDDSVTMVRWETKRGCPFSCRFCEWASLNGGHRGVAPLGMERLLEELALFSKSRIKKVNVLDATFNTGTGYLDLLEEMLRIPQITFSLQVRLELMARNGGDRLWELLRKARNIRLECGVQTVIKSEMATIGRQNKLSEMRSVLEKIAEIGVPCEASLIYGIPGQTFHTFQESIRFLSRHGCSMGSIRAFPLRLPKYSQIGKDDLKLRTGPIRQGFTELTVVQESSSFDRSHWKAMDDLASELNLLAEGAEQEAAGHYPTGNLGWWERY